MARMSTVLEHHLRTASPDDWIDVVLEVAEPSSATVSAPAPAADRSERIARAEQQFTSSNQDVIEGIQSAGGELPDGKQYPTRYAGF